MVEYVRLDRRWKTEGPPGSAAAVGVFDVAVGLVTHSGHRIGRSAIALIPGNRE